MTTVNGGTSTQPFREAFEHFYRREYRQVAALAYVLTGRSGTAEDLAQEAFVAAFRNWDRIGFYDKPEAWVRRVVANRAVSLRRRGITELKLLARLFRPPPPGPQDMDGEATEVWDAVRALPKRQAQAVAFRYLNDLSLEEIGVIMGCSAGTVKTHLARGRHRLERVLGIWTGEEVDRHVG
ncbi:MAG TPA: SigE family RNA polymerase sigma factor [Actinobacteria bacterium]|nr:SigE family RNA polymerase sigma factor [Actinomycetota bacterium]